MSYPSTVTALDPQTTTLGSAEIPGVATENQTFALSATTLYEVDSSGNPTTVPLGQSGPFVLLIDSEQILCATFSEGAVEVFEGEGIDGRGYGSTTIAQHNPAAPVTVYATSAQANSGGGAALVPVTLSANLNVDGSVAAQLLVLDTQPSMPDSNAFQSAATSTPTVVAPLGNVLDSPNGNVFGIDTTDDSFAVSAIITVSNLAATEVLQISAAVTVPVAGPNQNAGIDWTTADTTAVAGTDLAWDGTSVVTSTAGGVFIVSLSLQSSYS